MTKASRIPKKAAKPSKYRNQPTEVDGRTFASKREAKRYSELKLLERAKEIYGLELQPRFPLCVGSFLVCTYVADFRYFETRTHKRVVEDSKGFKTPEYIIKRKLMMAVYRIEVREV